MFPAARMSDPITHDLVAPSGTIAPSPYAPCPSCGAAPVLIEGLAAAHAGCVCVCSGAIVVGLAHPPGPPPLPPGPLPIATGSATVLIHGMPAVRWTPGPDVGGCGVLLGDMKLSPTRTVFLDQSVTAVPELHELNRTDWCLISKMFAAHGNTDYLVAAQAAAVVSAKLGERGWWEAFGDLHDEFNRLVVEPKDQTLRYDKLLEWSRDTMKELRYGIEFLERTDPRLPEVPAMRRRVHELSQKPQSIYSCPGVKERVEEMVDRVAWEFPPGSGNWHYSNDYA